MLWHLVFDNPEHLEFFFASVSDFELLQKLRSSSSFKKIFKCFFCFEVTRVKAETFLLDMEKRGRIKTRKKLETEMLLKKRMRHHKRIQRQISKQEEIDQMGHRSRFELKTLKTKLKKTGDGVSFSLFKNFIFQLLYNCKNRSLAHLFSDTTVSKSSLR